MKTRLLSILMLSSATLAAQAPVDKIIEEALKPSPIQKNLEVLTDKIGGRVPGTPAMAKAEQWGVDALKAAGADSTKLETFTLPSSWAEGETRVTVTSPVQFPVRAVSMAWAPATKGTLRARVIDVGNGNASELAKAGNLAGAILLVHSEILKTWDDLFQEYLKAPPIIEAAEKAKVAAIAFEASREHDVLYRHIQNQLGNIEKLPMVVVAREDAERIARLAKSDAVEMSLAMTNKVGGPINANNVIGEIRGSEKPDEFVILGAHLDSWELGTGALDDGCNAALVIDALRALKAAGVKPKRSIRFVLFSGEEQGTLGSLAYAQQHREELDRAAGLIIFDEGSGATTGFSLGGRKDLVEKTKELVAPFHQFGADQLTTDAFIGTDNLDFLLEGVPTFVANQKEANYMVNYHATSDTYDKVDFDQLKKHVAIAAALAYELADAPEHIGPRQSRAEIEQLMHETGLDQELKVFGMWPQWEKRERGRAE